MPFPLLFPALSFIFGIIFSSILNTGFSRWSITALALLLLTGWLCYFLKKDRAGLILILAGFFVSGFILHSFENKQYQNNPLRQLRAEGYLDFKGTLLRSPERRPDRDLLTIRVNQVEVAGQVKKIGGNLRLTVPHSTISDQPLELLAGDEIEFSASLNPEESFRNFFPDFMPRYLRSQKIQARAFTKSPLLIKRVSQRNHSLPGFFSKLRRNLQKKIEADFPGQGKFNLSPEGAILEALLLGEDGRLDQKTDRQFQKTGLYHLLAISGAHVAVITFLIYSLLQFFLIRKRTIHLILLFALIFYAFLVEGQPSVFRAVIMASLFFLGKIIFAEVNLLNTLSFSAIILLFINPFSIEDIGFQLTFLATLSLILFYQPIFRRLPQLPFKLSEMSALSAAAVVGTMPVIVYNFNRVTFASLILNIPAAPLVGLIMGIGYVYLVSSCVLPAAGHLLSFPLKLLVRFFAWLTTWLEPLSSLSYRIPSPPLRIILGFYAFLLLFLLKPKFRGQKLITAAGFLIFFFILITYPFKPASTGFTVTFIDVGQGDSVVIEFPGSQVMVIDAGGFPQSTFDPGENIVSPFLWHKGYKKIDYLVCSHLHPDHAGGIAALARNFRVKEYWYSEENPASSLDREIRQALSRKVIKRKIRTGLKTEVEKVQVEALYPDAEAFSLFKPGNDLSAVIRLDYGQQSFLFPADITRRVEEYLLSKHPEKLKATVLKLPHHGSRFSASQPFLEAVSPEWTVLTIGRNNVYGFPHPEIISTLEEKGIKIFRTDRDGAVEFKSDGQSLLIRTAAGKINHRYHDF
ncbi:MAG: DNA internalization-related competence protein ComEC/Rec2 [Candidatus Aminicenantes bacterium]|nr:DNA internalization-related competence protein ComEC/Rec2 [Candidatus Aminicenantes bacterium]